MLRNTQGLTVMDGRSQHNARTEVLHWDGRLDNRDDLLLRLNDSLGSDTSNAEIARATYERWGTSGLVHLIGDWSVVIRDHVNRTTVLASDFAGVRPLYYQVERGRVLWSSRLQSSDRGLSRLERLSVGLECNESQLRQIILLELWLRNRADGVMSEPMLRAA